MQRLLLPQSRLPRLSLLSLRKQALLASTTSFADWTIQSADRTNATLQDASTIFGMIRDFGPNEKIQSRGPMAGLEQEQQNRLTAQEPLADKG